MMCLQTKATPEQRGYQPYLDINPPDPGCKVLVKSPADTTTPGCGFLIGVFGQAVCAVLDIEKTFMVQFCCGVEQCNKAGGGTRRIRRSAKSGDVTVVEELDEEAAAAVAAGSIFSYQLRTVNGTLIEPAAVGLPPEAAKRAAEDGQTDASAAKESAFNPLRGRSGACESGSSVADPGKEDYTRPADNTQVVHESVSGPADIQITHERSQSWSTTFEASFSFEDVISLGMSFSESYEESITDGQAYSFHVPEDQKGTVGFTAYLECSTGHGRCNGAEVSGEVCVPYKIAGEIAGIYAVIVSS